MSTPDPGRPPYTTPNFGLPVPGGLEDADGVTALRELADRLDDVLQELEDAGGGGDGGGGGPADPWHMVGTEGEPPFQGSWQNRGTRPIRFRKGPDGQVTIRGHANVRSNPVAGGTIFTLPVGYRPQWMHRFPVSVIRPNAPVITGGTDFVDVNNTGTVSWAANPNTNASPIEEMVGGTLYLDTPTFQAGP